MVLKVSFPFLTLHTVEIISYILMFPYTLPALEKCLNGDTHK